METINKQILCLMLLLATDVQGAWAQTTVNSESDLHTAVTQRARPSRSALTSTLLNFDSIYSPSSFGEGLRGEAWFTFDGRRLTGQPSTKGIYIKNGNKIIIK